MIAIIHDIYSTAFTFAQMYTSFTDETWGNESQTSVSLLTAVSLVGVKGREAEQVEAAVPGGPGGARQLLRREEEQGASVPAAEEGQEEAGAAWEDLQQQ